MQGESVHDQDQKNRDMVIWDIGGPVSMSCKEIRISVSLNRALDEEDH